MDIMTTTSNKELTVAIMTNPNYRSTGEASSLAQQGKEWFDKNFDKYKANYLSWGAYSQNTASRRVAEKTGFKYDTKTSNNEWANYHYIPKKRR